MLQPGITAALNMVVDILAEFYSVHACRSDTSWKTSKRRQKILLPVQETPACHSKFLSSLGRSAALHQSIKLDKTTNLSKRSFGISDREIASKNLIISSHVLAHYYLPQFREIDHPVLTQNRDDGNCRHLAMQLALCARVHRAQLCLCS